MAVKKLGKQTVKLQSPPSIVATASIVGPKEGEGPLKDYFDIILDDDLFGEESWEKAESKMVKTVVTNSINKAGLTPDNIDYMFGGDLLNQIISSSFAARDLAIPFFGLYGACSTMTESLSLAAMIVDGGYAEHVVATTSSHFAAAERQFRLPLEMGAPRSPSAQWTATASGAAVVSRRGNGPYITYVTTGKVIDFGIKDASNMGAAMAPAAADTILRHFKDTGFSPKDYDLIVTGDLGQIGKELTIKLLKENNVDISDRYTDCGVELFDIKTQSVGSGASGCGCSAAVLCGHFYPLIRSGKFNRILMLSTGALMSPTSSLQGESIPGIAHAIAIERSI
ncbi:MAG: stage V sporulation protein AD [Clostridium sp.]